jgi:hypothetical protein
MEHAVLIQKLYLDKPSMENYNQANMEQEETVLKVTVKRLVNHFMCIVRGYMLPDFFANAFHIFPEGIFRDSPRERLLFLCRFWKDWLFPAGNGRVSLSGNPGLG